MVGGKDHLYNKFTCLSVCLSSVLWLAKRLGRFQKYFACWLPLGRGWFRKKKFWLDQKKNFLFWWKKIFSKIFRFFQTCSFFQKFQNSQKNSCQKFFLEKKIWEKQICSWASEASHVYLEYIGCRRHPLCECVRKYKSGWVLTNFQRSNCNV